MELIQLTQSVTVFFMKRTVVSAADFAVFIEPLIGLAASHIWNGYGSAIFLEFGKLTPSKMRRRDGSLRNPIGEFTLMIEWSWRIEGKRRVWCRSWSEAERWARCLPKLKCRKVAAISLSGRFPEIDITFDNGLHIASFMTSEGDLNGD